MSPLLVGPDSLATLAGTALPEPERLTLASVVEDDGFLLLRYLTGAGAAQPSVDGR